MRAIYYMSVTTRFQLVQGSFSSFSFEELPSPTRHPCKQHFDVEPIFEKVEEEKLATWYDTLIHFGSFGNTPRAKISVYLTMNQ